MMIFISGVISIIILKITICTNKNGVIYFCPNGVNFLLENFIFFICIGNCLPASASTPPPPPPARAPISKP